MQVIITEKQWAKIFKLRDVFAELYIKKTLYGYQKEVSNKIIKAVVLNTGETICIEHSRQSGKTEGLVVTLKFLLHWYYAICKQFGIPRPEFFNAGIFAPQQEQARTDFLRIKEYGELVRPSFPFDYLGNNSFEYKIKTAVYPPRTVYCFTLSPTSNPESKTLHLLIFEEAQDLQDFKMDKAAIPMGANTNAVKVFIGTAGYTKNRFCNLVHSLPPEQKVIVDYKRAIAERRVMYEKTGDILHLNYEKFIKGLIREVGEDSDEFKTQFALHWVLERGQFITYEKLFNIEKPYTMKMKKISKINFSTEFPDDEDPIYVPIDHYLGKCTGGIDWGKASDSTVLTIVNDKGQIIYWLELLGDDYSSQIHTLSHVLLKYFPNCTHVNVDATGNQDMGADELRSQLQEKFNEIRVYAVKFTSQSKHSMYTNLYRLMAGKTIDGQIIEEPWLSFPNQWPTNCKEKFIKQFLDLQKEIKNNMWACHHPDGKNYHDDYTDSLALAVYDEKYEVSSFKFSKVH